MTMGQHASANACRLEPRSIDVPSALRALAAAVVLLGLYSTSGLLPPLLAAGAVGIYAIVYPLRLPQLLTSRPFLSLLAKLTRVGAGLLVAAICSVVAVNCGNEALAITGNLGMVATTLAAGVLFLWSVSLAVRRIVGAMRQSVPNQLQDWRTAFAIVLWGIRRERA